MDEITIFVIGLAAAGLWIIGNACHHMVRIYGNSSRQMNRVGNTRISVDENSYDQFVFFTKYMIITRVIAMVYLIALVPYGTYEALKLIAWFGRTE